jgi:molybdopterin-binding protein
VLAVKNLEVDLGEFLLQDISLNVNRGEYSIILGPTGSGKTVLLEAIAGLYPAKKGEIWLDGRKITNLPPERREIAFVYQDYALFPHLSVKDNIAFGLKLKKVPKKEIASKVEEMADFFGISHLVRRKPNTLSGGEQQRVALARALVSGSKIFLLDEPLSALDPEMKESVQQELRRLHKELNLTVVHVTHDFEEAMALGERIAVLGGGHIVQEGTTEEIFRKPSSEFVARFSMARNIFKGRVQNGNGEYSVVEVEGVPLRALTKLRGEVNISLRPEDILISEELLHSSARNSLQGKITQILDKGATIYITVSTPLDFVCLITRQSFEEMELKVGKEVYLTFKASAVHIF